MCFLRSHFLSVTKNDHFAKTGSGQSSSTCDKNHSVKWSVSQALGASGVRTSRVLRHLYIKAIILPRQARDKHRENSKKCGVSAGANEPCADDHRDGGVRNPPFLRNSTSQKTIILPRQARKRHCKKTLRENAVSGSSESSVLRGVPSVGCAGAVLVRVARSFVRFGSFERCEKTPPPRHGFYIIYLHTYILIYLGILPLSL